LGRNPGLSELAVAVELPKREVKDLLLPGAATGEPGKPRWATAEDTELLDLLQGDGTPARGKTSITSACAVDMAGRCWSNCRSSADCA